MSILGLDVAARAYIVSSPAFITLKSQNIVGFDSLYTDGHVFRCNKANVPYVNPEGSGKGVICLTIFDSWATSSYHSSNFPNLLISIYADRDRDLSNQGNPVGDVLSAKDRALKIYEAINPLFDDTANTIHRFGSFPIISTIAGGGFYIDDVSGGDGVVRLDQIYNVHTY